MPRKLFVSEDFERAAIDRWDEIDFMMDQGISAEEIARRIGTNPIALARQAYRYGWTERARRFNSAAKKNRKSRVKAA